MDKHNTFLVDDFNQVDMLNAPQKILDLYKDIIPYKDHKVEEVDSRGYIMRRPLFSHSALPTSYCFDLTPIKLSDYDETFNTSYYVFMHHHLELAASNLHIIPDKVLNLVRQKKCRLILDDTLEGDNITDFLNILYNCINKLNLPANQIYYISNNLLGEESHKKWRKKNNREEYINVVSFMWNIFDMKRLIKHKLLPKKLNIEEEIQYKKEQIEANQSIKHFLKVNRTDRLERNLMMLFMNKYNILDKSLISFPSLPSLPYSDLFKDIIDEKNQLDLASKMPFDIDQTDTDNHGEPGSGKGCFNADLPFQPIHYRNSFFSIVMCAFPETPNACHLHSSTFNPMWCGHPVIQYGPYLHIKELQKRGFKTFNKWWDESYDNIKDNHKRLRAVMDIVLKLSKLSSNEILDMYIDMKDVLQFNHDLMSKYSITKYLKDRIYEPKFL